jgi:hypothetical protein
MSTTAAIVGPDVLDFGEDILEKLSAVVREWAAHAGPLRLYPWQTCAGNPSPEALRRHKLALERMITLGRLFHLSTGAPEFPDPKTAALVSATLQMLQDDLNLWHGTDLTEAEAEEIMQKCFPE